MNTDFRFFTKKLPFSISLIAQQPEDLRKGGLKKISLLKCFSLCTTVINLTQATSSAFQVTFNIFSSKPDFIWGNLCLCHSLQALLSRNQSFHVYWIYFSISISCGKLEVARWAAYLIFLLKLKREEVSMSSGLFSRIFLMK